MELNPEYQVQPRVHRHLQKALADGHAALLSSSFAISWIRAQKNQQTPPNQGKQWAPWVLQSRSKHHGLQLYFHFWYLMGHSPTLRIPKTKKKKPWVSIWYFSCNFRFQSRTSPEPGPTNCRKWHCDIDSLRNISHIFDCNDSREEKTKEAKILNLHPLFGSNIGSTFITFQSKIHLDLCPEKQWI